MEEGKKNRYIYIDILNIMACFFVVVLHCSKACFRVDGTKRWFFSTGLHAVTICAVPIFFLITGAMLIDYRKRYTTKAFYKKRFLKVVAPFLIWSIVYSIWKQTTGQLEIVGIKDFINKFLNNEIVSIFWFFYTIIGIYLAIPVISVLFKKGNRKLIWLYCYMCIFTVGVIPLINRVAGLNLSKFGVPIAGSTMVYIALGWLLKQEQISSKLKKVLYAGGVISALCMFIGTCYYTYGYQGIHLILNGQSLSEKISLDTTFLTSTSFFSIILSTAVFVFIKSVDWECILNERFIKIVSKLSSLSFGIYLVQIMVMYYIERLSFIDVTSPEYGTVGAVAVYAICAAIVFLLKKIPLLRKSIP